MPSPLPVALPRDGFNAAYGVHAAVPGGSGSSPRIASQIRSGLSAYTPPNDPQVQPSCECRVSGSGFGQFSTTRYGPVGQSWWLQRSFGAAAAFSGSARLQAAAPANRTAAAIVMRVNRTRIDGPLLRRR